MREARQIKVQFGAKRVGSSLVSFLEKTRLPAGAMRQQSVCHHQIKTSVRLIHR